MKLSFKEIVTKMFSLKKEGCYVLKMYPKEKTGIFHCNFCFDDRILFLIYALKGLRCDYKLP